MMSLERLALMGIVVFIFIAAVQLFSATRTLKRSMRQRTPKPRRLTGSEAVARQMADGLVADVIAQNKDAVTEARNAGRITPELEHLFEESMAHFCERVPTKFKSLFYASMQCQILNSGSPDPRSVSSQNNSKTSPGSNSPGTDKGSIQ